ncbi:MAG: magnesium transporter [Actinomycetota bacterium]
MKTPTPDRVRRSANTRARRVAGVAIRPARAALGPARALAATLRYWQAERATLRQGFVALGISSGGDLIAGIVLAAMTHRLEELPSLLVLVPAAIGMRGNIFGAVGSRLGTSIHTGLFHITGARTGVLYQNAYASILLSILTSAFLAVAARLVSAVFGLPSISVWDFLAISVIGGVVSSAIVLALTVLLAMTSYRREWDLDSVAAPIVTFIGDTVTLPSLFAASYIALRHNVTLLVGVAVTALSIWALVALIRTDLPIARRILRESVVVLALAGIFDLLAGTLVEGMRGHLLALPALVVLIPPFLEDAGSLGSIVSARLASKLHMGAIRPRLIPDRLAFLDITLAAPFAMSVFTLLGVSAHVVARIMGLPSPGLLLMVALSLVAGYMTTIGAAVVAYAVAVATFRFGLDPDNHGVPIVTSSIDLVGMLSLAAGISLLRVT